MRHPNLPHSVELSSQSDSVGHQTKAVISAGNKGGGIWTYF